MEETTKKFELSLPAAILVGAVIIAGAILLTRMPAKRAELPKQPSAFPITADDHVRGAADPKVTFIEYSDTECPFCKAYHQDLKELLAAYPDDVAWAYRHFPLESLHAKAKQEAVATECAAELGGNDAFWKYVDTLFEKTPSNDGLDLALLPQFAEDIGLDRQAFEACLASGRHEEKVEDQARQAVLSGAEGTPFTIIVTDTGQSIPLSGARSFESLKGFVEATLES